jgi:hypothetical protein
MVHAYIPEIVLSVLKAGWVTRYLIVFLLVGMARAWTAFRILSDLEGTFP